MDQLLSKKKSNEYSFIRNKKANGNILLSFFFIVIVLLIIGIFTNFHKTILITNFNINNKNLLEKEINSLSLELQKCYGSPLKITSIENCSSINNLNFEIKIISNGLCKEEVILKNGVKNYENMVSIFLPVFDKDLNICPSQIYLYKKK